MPAVSRTEVAKHYKLDSLWIIINNLVYDVTDYLKSHPGGLEILRSYCGRDATEYFSLVQKHLKMGKKLDSLRIATLEQETDTRITSLEIWYKILDASIRTYALLEIQYQKKEAGLLAIVFAEQTHQHFCGSHLINLFGFLERDFFSK